MYRMPGTSGRGGGGCYTFCEGKRFIPIPTEEKPQNIQETIAQYGAEDAIHLQHNLINIKP